MQSFVSAIWGQVLSSGRPTPATPEYTVSKVDDKNHLTTVASQFEPATKNFSQFSQAVKAWPFVLPDGKIAAFLCDGTLQHSGFLTAWLDGPVGCFETLSSKADVYNLHDYQGHPCPADGNLLIFQATDNGFRSYCYSGPVDRRLQCVVTLYPIPFSAASGVEWKGSSVTFGLGKLTDILGELRRDLGQLNQWSFDHAYWKGTQPKDIKYNMGQVDPTYIGLVDEPKNIWR